MGKAERELLTAVFRLNIPGAKKYFLGLSRKHAPHQADTPRRAPPVVGGLGARPAVSGARGGA